MKWTVGETVHCGGDSGFCSHGEEKIVKIETQYDVKTGKPYQVVCLSEGRKFDGRNGGAITPPYAYHIDKIKKTEKSEENTELQNKCYEIVNLDVDGRISHYMGLFLATSKTHAREIASKHYHNNEISTTGYYDAILRDINHINKVKKNLQHQLKVRTTILNA